MALKMKPLAEINQQAIRVLYRELGVVNAVRFLRQFTTGFGDYSREREALFEGKSLQDICSEIDEQQKKPSAGT